MKKQSKIAAIAVALSLGTGLFVQGQAQAYDSRAMFSPDQLLDHSFDDLREAMRNAKQENMNLQEQNRQLLKSISELEDALSDVQSDQQVMTAQSAHWSGDEDLAKQEMILYKARMENLNMRYERLKSYHSELAKNIDYYSQDNIETQTQVAGLKKDLSGIKLALGSSPKDNRTPGRNLMAQDKKALALHQKQIIALQKKLTYQKNRLQPYLAQVGSYTQENAVLDKQLESYRQELAQLKVPPMVVALSQRNDSQVRREIDDLENHRDRLEESLRELQKAAAVVKKASRINPLEDILNIYQKNNAALLQKLALLKSDDDLMDQKKELILKKQQLLAQLEQAKMDFPSAAESSLGSAQALKVQLQNSRENVKALQTKISSLRLSTPLGKRNQDLTGQIAVLEQDLQNLKNHPQSPLTTEAIQVQQEIAQLEARKMILSQSVQEIYKKYNLDELPTGDIMAQQMQMKDYFETLRLENSALQQKLLTLQMRQDKNVSQLQ